MLPFYLSFFHFSFTFFISSYLPSFFISYLSSLPLFRFIYSSTSFFQFHSRQLRVLYEPPICRFSAKSIHYSHSRRIRWRSKRWYVRAYIQHMFSFSGRCSCLLKIFFQSILTFLIFFSTILYTLFLNFFFNPENYFEGVFRLNFSDVTNQNLILILGDFFVNQNTQSFFSILLIILIF